MVDYGSGMRNEDFAYIIIIIIIVIFFTIIIVIIIIITVIIIIIVIINTIIIITGDSPAMVDYGSGMRIVLTSSSSLSS